MLHSSIESNSSSYRRIRDSLQSTSQLTTKPTLLKKLLAMTKKNLNCVMCEKPVIPPDKDSLVLNSLCYCLASKFVKLKNTKVFHHFLKYGSPANWPEVKMCKSCRNKLALMTFLSPFSANSKLDTSELIKYFTELRTDLFDSSEAPDNTGLEAYESFFQKNPVGDIGKQFLSLMLTKLKEINPSPAQDNPRPDEVSGIQLGKIPFGPKSENVQTASAPPAPPPTVNKSNFKKKMIQKIREDVQEKDDSLNEHPAKNPTEKAVVEIGIQTSSMISQETQTLSTEGQNQREPNNANNADGTSSVGQTLSNSPSDESPTCTIQTSCKGSVNLYITPFNPIRSCARGHSTHGQCCSLKPPDIPGISHQVSHCCNCQYGTTQMHHHRHPLTRPCNNASHGRSNNCRPLSKSTRNPHSVNQHPSNEYPNPSQGQSQSHHQFAIPKPPAETIVYHSQSSTNANSNNNSNALIPLQTTPMNPPPTPVQYQQRQRPPSPQASDLLHMVNCSGTRSSCSNEQHKRLNLMEEFSKWRDNRNSQQNNSGALVPSSSSSSDQTPNPNNPRSASVLFEHIQPHTDNQFASLWANFEEGRKSRQMSQDLTQLVQQSPVGGNRNLLQLHSIPPTNNNAGDSPETQCNLIQRPCAPPPPSETSTSSDQSPSEPPSSNNKTPPPSK